jgi:SAM-dependent methyltransferase
MAMYDSHSKAKELFDAIAVNYQERAEARVYSFSSLIFQRRISIVEKFLHKVPQNGRVLDFGMGPAVFAKFCEKKGLSYLGIDISPMMVERAKALNLRNSEFIVGDLDSLSGFGKSMDAVLAIGLIDYLEDPGSGIELLAQCVKPSGYLILSFRNRFSLPRLLRDSVKALWRVLPKRKTVQSDKAFFASVHERSFDFSLQLRPELIQLGFDEFEVDYFNCSPFFFNFPINPWIWQKWYGLDSRISSQHVHLMCSGGVVIAKRLR